MNYYRPPTFSLFPPVVKNLLIANALFFIATYVIQSTYNYDITGLLGLHYFQSKDFKFFQIFTYMFLHGGFAHIAFNMFALWMFGQMLENYWGSKRFLFFYLTCGIGAAITQEATQYIYFHKLWQSIELFNSAPSIAGFNELVQHYFPTVSGYANPQTIKESSDILSDLYKFAIDNSNTIGASGAIFGVLLAFGMLFPNTLLYVYFAIPVKAKYFVIIYGLIELFSAVRNNPGDNVAHYAHLGGMLFGFFLIMYWKRNRIL